MTVVFTVGKVQAKSYLEQQPDAVRELAEVAAKAFVKARDRKPRQKRRSPVIPSQHNQTEAQ